MVLLGGLEIVAAGYLIHKHNKNKREKALLREELALAEEELAAEPRPHRHHSSHPDETKEERRERHRRRRSRERREQEKWEAEHNASWQGRPGRDHSAPPKIHTPVPVPVPVVQPVRPAQTQTQQPGFPPTGWPAHWKQSQTPPTPPPQTQRQANGYPPDIKYGFVPEIPHEQYPPYPPPPFSPGPSGRDPRGRASTLDVNEGREGRGRRHRRSASPRIGVVDEYERSPMRQQVRFSNEDVVLGGSGSGSGRGRRSPPPSYSSRT